MLKMYALTTSSSLSLCLSLYILF